MRRKFLSILSALLAAMLLTSTVFAGYIKLSNVTFSLGTDTSTNSGGLQLMALLAAESGQSSFPTLNATGTMTGLGKDDVIVQLQASGFPEVTCTNQGGNQAPGQNPPKVSSVGDQYLDGDISETKNGKSPFNVTTDPADLGSLDAIAYGCPNDNWSAQIDFIYWTDATITVFDLGGNELQSQDYTCTTTLTSVTCKPVK